MWLKDESQKVVNTFFQMTDCKELRFDRKCMILQINYDISPVQSKVFHTSDSKISKTPKPSVNLANGELTIYLYLTQPLLKFFFKQQCTHRSNLFDINLHLVLLLSETCSLAW